MVLFGLVSGIYLLVYCTSSLLVDQQAKPVCVACSGGQVTCEMLPQVSVYVRTYV